MFNIKGRLLNSLSYHLIKEEHKWRKNNYRREIGYSFLRRFLLSISDNPIIVNIYVSLLVLGITIGLLIGLNDPHSEGQSSEISTLASYFTTLWTVQAAISGLIYPIVISFVTLLLQRRHSAKSSLDVYLNDTFAILSGVSGLSLILVMAIQHWLLVKANNDVIIKWMLWVDIPWFVIILIGTIWFLSRSFEYLRPDVRAEIYRKYAINVVFPREVNEYLRTLYYSTAPEQGLLRGLDLDRSDEVKGQLVVFGDFGLRTGVEEVGIDIKEKNIASTYIFGF